MGVCSRFPWHVLRVIAQRVIVLLAQVAASAATVAEAEVTAAVIAAAMTVAVTATATKLTLAVKENIRPFGRMFSFVYADCIIYP